jgi:hypothetical protein
MLHFEFSIFYLGCIFLMFHEIQSTTPFFIRNGGGQCRNDDELGIKVDTAYKLDSDVALLELDWDIGLRTGYQGVGMDIPLDTSVPVTSFGYPSRTESGARNFRTMYDADARTVPPGVFAAAWDRSYLTYDTFGGGGRSGSGVRRNNAVVGVFMAGSSKAKSDERQRGFGPRVLPPLVKLVKLRRAATSGVGPARPQLVLDQRNENFIQFSLQKGPKLEPALSDTPFQLTFSVLNAGTSSSSGGRIVQFTLFKSNAGTRWLDSKGVTIGANKETVSIQPTRGSVTLPSIAVGSSHTVAVEFELSTKEAQARTGRWWLTASWDGPHDYQDNIHPLADAQRIEVPILINSIDCSKMGTWVGTVAAAFERGTQAMIQCSRFNSVQQCQTMFDEIAQALMIANGLASCKYVFVRRVEFSESSQGFATWNGGPDPRSLTSSVETQ